MQIALRDNAGAASISWTLNNALMVKLEGAKLDDPDAGITIDLIELAYASITVKGF